MDHRSVSKSSLMINRPDERKREEAALARSAQIKLRADDSPSPVPEDNRFQRMEHNYNNNDLTKSIQQILNPYKKVLNGGISSQSVSSGKNGFRNPSLPSYNISSKSNSGNTTGNEQVISENGIRQSKDHINTKYNSSKRSGSTSSLQQQQSQSNRQQSLSKNSNDQKSSSIDPQTASRTSQLSEKNWSSPTNPTVLSPHNSTDAANKHQVNSSGHLKNHTHPNSALTNKARNLHQTANSIDNSVKSSHHSLKTKRPTELNEKEKDRNQSTSPRFQSSSRSSNNKLVTSSSNSNYHHSRNLSPDPSTVSPKHSVPVDPSKTKSNLNAVTPPQQDKPSPSHYRPTTPTPTKPGHPPNGLVNTSTPVTLTSSTPWSSAIVTTSASSSLVTSNSSSKYMTTSRASSSQKKSDKRIKLIIPPTTKSDLNDIFKDMECPQLHTAIQTPQKPNNERFPFMITDKTEGHSVDAPQDTNQSFKWNNDEDNKGKLKDNVTTYEDSSLSKNPFSKRNDADSDDLVMVDSDLMFAPPPDLSSTHMSPPLAALSPLSSHVPHQPPSSLSSSTAASGSTITTTATNFASPATSASPLTFGIGPLKGPRTPPMSPPPDCDSDEDDLLDRLDGGDKIPFSNTSPSNWKDNRSEHNSPKKYTNKNPKKDLNDRKITNQSVHRDGVHQESDVDLKSDLEISSDSETEQPVEANKTSCGQSGKGKVMDLAEKKVQRSQLSSSSGSSSSSSDGSSDEDDDDGRPGNKAIKSPLSVMHEATSKPIQYSDSSDSDNSSDSSDNSGSEEEDEGDDRKTSSGQTEIQEQHNRGSTDKEIKENETPCPTQDDLEFKWSLRNFVPAKKTQSPFIPVSTPPPPPQQSATQPATQPETQPETQPANTDCLSTDTSTTDTNPSRMKTLKEIGPSSTMSFERNTLCEDNENESSDSEISHNIVKKKNGKSMKSSEKTDIKETNLSSKKDGIGKEKSFKRQSSVSSLKKDQDSCSKDSMQNQIDEKGDHGKCIDLNKEKQKPSPCTDDEIDVESVTPVKLLPKKNQKGNTSRALLFEDNHIENDMNKTYTKPQHINKTPIKTPVKTPFSSTNSLSGFNIRDLDLESISRPINLLSPVHACSPTPAISPKPLPSFQTSFSPKPGNVQSHVETPLSDHETPPFVTLHHQKDGSSKPRILTRIMQQFLSDKQLTRLKEKREKRRLLVKSETMKSEVKSEPVTLKCEIPDKKVDLLEARVPPIAIENPAEVISNNFKKEETSTHQSMPTSSTFPSKQSSKSRSNKRKANESIEPHSSPISTQEIRPTNTPEKPQKKTKSSSTSSLNSPFKPLGSQVTQSPSTLSPSHVPVSNGQREKQSFSLPNANQAASKDSTLNEKNQTVCPVFEETVPTTKPESVSVKNSKRPAEEQGSLSDAKRQKAASLLNSQSGQEDDAGEEVPARNKRDRRDSTESRGSRKSNSGSTTRKSRHSSDGPHKTTSAAINSNKNNNNNDKAELRNGPLEPPALVNGIGHSNTNRSNPRLPPPQSIETQLGTTDSYLARAKEHKHHADNLKKKKEKLEPYLRSGLSFYLAGCSMEKGREDKSCIMYKETADLLTYATNLRTNDNELTEKQKKVYVLLVRLKSYLFHRMYILKRLEVLKYRKNIETELSKLQNSVNSSGQAKPPAPSPHQNSWNKTSTGTPSPMSLPASSPAGSVSSQGSGDQIKSNGILSSGSTPITSPCPGSSTLQQKQLFAIQKKYNSITSSLIDAHELWDQADRYRVDLEDFFSIIDNACGPITFHSEPPVVVRYMKHALRLLTL